MPEHMQLQKLNGPDAVASVVLLSSKLNARIDMVPLAFSVCGKESRKMLVGSRPALGEFHSRQIYCYKIKWGVRCEALMESTYTKRQAKTSLWKPYTKSMFMAGLKTNRWSLNAWDPTGLAGLKHRSQVRSQVRSQITGQVTGKVTGQVIGHRSGH